ncbi:hypothetical protein RND71_034481 [Anisodus tanguticus]|uniref:4-alpha-glucanotransferase n=1 Tax=Anisodus tanguticus TaxID=243964 RepID=A0AAE1UYF3_9SOLA|nr:hypothetical protein RND71_034481 [Anisodus tanguticus]
MIGRSSDGSSTKLWHKRGRRGGILRRSTWFDQLEMVNLGLTGNKPLKSRKGLLLKPSHQGEELIWSGSIPVPPGFQSEYSYNVVDDKRNIVRWEVGMKRKLLLPDGLQDGQLLELHDLWQFLTEVGTGESGPKVALQYCKYGKAGTSVECDASRELSIDVTTGESRFVVFSDGLMREMPWRGAGVVVPMFSVRSEADLGVGEFLDLKLPVDWAVESGFHLVQLLPINDTSVNCMWWDSYPYSSLSVFALHPLYLRVEAISENIPEDIKQEIREARDYDASLATKLSIAKKIFAREKETVLNSKSFQEFFSENQEWLKPYATFCFLRDFFETSERSQWGHFSEFSKEKLEKLISKESLHYEVVSAIIHLGFPEAAEYARKKGVVLKDDLPIGVDRNSVDTWIWGLFPTYNWEEMSKDNYGWWRARLTQMGKYFTAYRIDHEELESEGLWDFNRLTSLILEKSFYRRQPDRRRPENDEESEAPTRLIMVVVAARKVKTEEWISSELRRRCQWRGDSVRFESSEFRWSSCGDFVVVDDDGRRRSISKPSPKILSQE